MGRNAIVVALVAALVALGIGVGAGWALRGDGGSEDADLACAGAERLPEEFPDDLEGEERIVLLNRIVGVGLLAQAAGQDGDGIRDLDTLGQAGLDLSSIVQNLQVDRYDDALDDLLDACADR